VLGGGGRGGSLDGNLKPSPLPQDADSPPKQAGFGKVAISPRDGWSLKSIKVAESRQGTMCGGHVTSADLGGSKSPFSVQLLKEWF
jgi:hypothetical protein